MKAGKSLIYRVLAGLLVLLFANAGAGNAQDAAYRSGSRPLDNYFKVAAGWAGDDLKKGKELVTAHKKDSNASTNEQVLNFGRKILEKYNSDIAGLIKDWEKHISEPLPAAPIKKELAEFENPGLLDLNFCENISCTLAAVTRALIADGRADDALKLFMLNLRFNQFFAGRDAFFMGLLVANKVVRTVIDADIWQLINSGKISPELLKTVIGHFSRLHKEEVDFAVMIDNLFTLKRLHMEIYKKDCLNPEPTELPPDLKMNEGYFRAVSCAMSDGFKTQPESDKIIVMFDELMGEMNAMFSRYRELFLTNKAKPAELIRLEDQFYENDLMLMAKVDENGMLLDTGTISNLKFLGRKYFMTLPDPAYVKMYLDRLELKYRILGTGLLALAILQEGSTRSDLQGIAAKIEKRLPPDIFTDPRQPCRMAIKGNTLSVWSIGKGDDQEGDPESDILLFSITR